MPGLLSSLLGGKPKRVQPPRVPTDEVIPMFLFDDVDVNRKIIMAWTLRFNEILEPEMLHTSLSRLLEIGDWKKLGGRIRMGVSFPILTDPATKTAMMGAWRPDKMRHTHRPLVDSRFTSQRSLRPSAPPSGTPTPGMT